MKYDNCQSCGMPLKQDPKGGGTEANGTRSVKYCSYCLTDGRFTQPAMTVDEMKAFVVEKMREIEDSAPSWALLHPQPAQARSLEKLTAGT